MTTKISSPFWKLANTGSLKSERNGSAPWDLKVEISRDDEKRLEIGSPIDQFAHPIRARAVQSTRREDIPYCDGDALVASGRVRALWESLFPGNVQFIPISIELPGSTQVADDYYILNLLKIVDCIDEPATIKKYGHMLAKQLIVPSRVPDDVGIFRMQTFKSSMVVRDSVRAAMKSERITGWFAYEP